MFNSFRVTDPSVVNLMSAKQCKQASALVSGSIPVDRIPLPWMQKMIDEGVLTQALEAMWKEVIERLEPRQYRTTAMWDLEVLKKSKHVFEIDQRVEHFKFPILVAAPIVEIHNAQFFKTGSDYEVHSIGRRHAFPEELLGLMFGASSTPEVWNSVFDLTGPGELHALGRVMAVEGVPRTMSLVLKPGNCDGVKVCTSVAKKDRGWSNREYLLLVPN